HHVVNGQQPVGEGGVTMTVLPGNRSLLLVDDALRPVPVHRDREVHADGVLVVDHIGSGRLEGDNITRTTEAITFADKVFHRYAFITDAGANLQPVKYKAATSA